MVITPVFLLYITWSGDGHAGARFGQPRTLPPGVDEDDLPNYLVVDMSNYPTSSTDANGNSYSRPNGTGIVISPTQISVNFPDDKAYTATLVPGVDGEENRIVFSNGSIWTPLPYFPTLPMFPVDGRWASGGVSGPYCRDIGGLAVGTAEIDMSSYGRRPATLRYAAFGYVIVDFQDPAEEVKAYLRWPPSLEWTNGSEWTLVRPSIEHSSTRNSDGPMLQITGRDFPPNLSLNVTIAKNDGSAPDTEPATTNEAGIFSMQTPSPVGSFTIDAVAADPGVPYFPYVTYNPLPQPAAVSDTVVHA